MGLLAQQDHACARQGSVNGTGDSSVRQLLTTQSWFAQESVQRQRLTLLHCSRSLTVAVEDQRLCLDCFSSHSAGALWPLPVTAAALVPACC